MEKYSITQKGNLSKFRTTHVPAKIGFILLVILLPMPYNGNGGVHTEMDRGLYNFAPGYGGQVCKIGQK